MSTVQGDPATYAAMTVRQKKAFWRANPVRGEIPIAIGSIPPLLMYSDNDDTVVKELYWTGFQGWERTSLHLWGRIAAVVSPGLVLDVGCYSGIYSLIAAKANTSHRVLAIDIQPRCLARVERNRALNGVANIERSTPPASIRSAPSATSTTRTATFCPPPIVRGAQADQRSFGRCPCVERLTA